MEVWFQVTKLNLTTHDSFYGVGCKATGPIVFCLLWGSSMNYDDHFDILDYELKQQIEQGDADSAYEFINYNRGIDYTNETIKELVEFNHQHWITEELFYFNSATQYLEIPAIYKMVLAYYNASDNAMRIPSDASDMYADVRAVSARKLYFRTEQSKGDSIMLRVVKYPPDIVQGSDTVSFPEQHLRFLRLRIISKALGRAGKQWNDLMQREYLLAEDSFRKYGNDIKRGTRISGRGAGFGY